MESKQVANEHIDPMSRNYSFDKINEDERFVQSKKEFFIVSIMFFIHAFILIFNLFINAGNAANYTYVLGLPLWLFLQLVEFVIFIAVCFIVVTYVFKDMDIDPIGKIIPRKSVK